MRRGPVPRRHVPGAVASAAMTSSGTNGSATSCASAPLIDGHDDLLWELRDDPRARAGAAPTCRRTCPSLQTDLPRLEAAASEASSGRSTSPPTSRDTRVSRARSSRSTPSTSSSRASRPAGARADRDRCRGASRRAGRVASMIGVEGGHAIGCSLGALRALARIGAGYLTLTHNDDTPWADSATGLRPHGGLTRFGEEVVRELNRSGVLVDLSHVSDDVMRQAFELSEAPPIFSHSSARAIADVTRNVPDDVLELVARAGAVVMVAFVPSFLTAEGAARTARLGPRRRASGAEHPDDPQASARSWTRGTTRIRTRRRRSATSPTTSTTCASSPASTTSASAATSTARARCPWGSRTSRATPRCSRSSRRAATPTRTSRRSPAATCCA